MRGTDSAATACGTMRRGQCRLGQFSSKDARTRDVKHLLQREEERMSAVELMTKEGSLSWRSCGEGLEELTQWVKSGQLWRIFASSDSDETGILGCGCS